MLNDSIKKRIIQVVQELDTRRHIQDQIWNEDLTKLGITSIEYIHIIVAIENTFDIELPAQALDIAKYPTLQSIGELVGQLTSVH